jgi:hypothetical protein
MDPRIRIHPKMSWIRNTGKKFKKRKKVSGPVPSLVFELEKVSGSVTGLQIRIQLDPVIKNFKTVEIKILLGDGRIRIRGNSYGSGTW